MVVSDRGQVGGDDGHVVLLLGGKGVLTLQQRSRFSIEAPTAIRLMRPMHGWLATTQAVLRRLQVAW
jgi:hypothetical protein